MWLSRCWHSATSSTSVLCRSRGSFTAIEAAPSRPSRASTAESVRTPNLSGKSGSLTREYEVVDGELYRPVSDTDGARSAAHGNPAQRHVGERRGARNGDRGIHPTTPFGIKLSARTARLRPYREVVTSRRNGGDLLLQTTVRRELP